MRFLINTLLLFLFMAFSTHRPIQADINWNGRMCNGGHGICYTQKDEKLTVKTEIAYDKTYHELIFRIPEDRISKTLQNRLFYHPVKKNVYLYTFDAPNYLPAEVYKRLGIARSPIKAGDYLWILKNNYWELRVKLQ